MTSKKKLILLMLIPMWGTLINIFFYMKTPTNLSYAQKKKPLIIMTLIALISYLALTSLNNVLKVEFPILDNYHTLTLLIIGYLVNLIHFLHYTIKHI